MPHVRGCGELGRDEPWPEVFSLGQKEIFVEAKEGRPQQAFAQQKLPDPLPGICVHPSF